MSGYVDSRIAECFDCGWVSDDEKKALIHGRAHSKKYGHDVYGTTVTHYNYTSPDVRSETDGT